MKHLTLFLLVVLSLLSCKKSETTPKEILLSAILEDGKLVYKFFYDDQKRLYQYDTYDDAGTSLVQTIEFDYESDNLVKGFIAYEMPGNVPSVRAVYEYNDLGQRVKAESYQLQGANPNTPNAILDYTYNVSGRLSVMNWRNKDGELTTRTNYSYFPDGNLKETNKYHPAGNQLWHGGRVSYSLPGTNEVKGMEKFFEIFGIENYSLFLSETQHYYTYDQNGVISNYYYLVLSNREMNEDGTIKRHVSTRTKVKPVGDVVITNYSFEYITQ